jgi:branched-chain amino acid transport system substrate-binding protein
MKKAGCVLILVVALFLGSNNVSLAQEKKEIVVGMTLCLTGRFAVEVGVFDRLVKAWENYVNTKQGGLYVKAYNKKLPVRTIIYDDKSDQATAVKFYERLVTVDKCDLLMGPKSSPITFPVTNVSEKYQVPMVLISANTPAIFNRNYKWFVCVNGLSTYWSKYYFNSLEEGKKAKTFGFVAEDTPHTREVFEGAIPDSERRGFKVVFKEIAPAETTDFTPILVKLKALDPDIIYLSTFVPMGIAFRKQAKEFGLKPREWHFIHIAKNFYDALGKDTDGATGEFNWLPGMKYGNLKKFLEIVKEAKLNPEEYNDLGLNYAALEAGEVGIEKAESLKPDDLMKSLWASKFESILGPISYEPNKGNSSYQQCAVQYIKGKLYIISPKECVTHKHVYPTP